MTELVQIISTVGFPIVSFLIAAYFIKYTYDKTTEANKEAMEEQKIKAEEQAKNTKKTIELLNLIQKDIDSYKVMANEEIESATKTCCEVAERIKKEA